jgi:aspartate/methionine/tyrosine aminotransferase
MVGMTPAQPPSPSPADQPARRRVSARIAGIAESATLAVDAKAKAKKAAGEDVVGFGAGEPDFPTPPAVVAAAAEACSDPSNHRYTPAGGMPALKAAVAAKTARDSGLQVTPAQVLITNGGKQAVYAAFATLLDPGDEVLLPAPYWTTYPEAIRLAGGVPVDVVTDESQGYRVTVEQLEAARTERTKVLLWCSPSNPTGAVASPDEVRAVGEWALEHGIWVVADEIYEHLVYGDAEHVSMPVVVPGLADTCVVVNGVAKTYAMTGWRVGWLIGPADVVKGATNLQSHATSNVSNVAQVAALAGRVRRPVGGGRDEGRLRPPRQTMVRLLNDIPGRDLPGAGGRLLRLPVGQGRARQDAARAHPADLRRAGRAGAGRGGGRVVPGEAFGTPGYFRLSYALGDADLEKGVQRLAALLAEATGAARELSRSAAPGPAAGRMR